MLKNFFVWLNEENTPQKLSSVLIVGATVAGTCYALYRINTNWKTSLISKKSQSILKKTSLYTIGTIGLTSLPSLLIRYLPRNTVIKSYQTLFSNKWITWCAFVGTVVITGSTIFISKEKQKAKHALWVTSCLSIGTLLGPSALLPFRIIDIAFRYTAAVTLPLLSIAAVAQNKAFYFLSSTILMGTSVFVLSDQAKTKYGAIAYLPLFGLFTNAFLQIWNMNRIINQIEYEEDFFGEKKRT